MPVREPLTPAQHIATIAEPRRADIRRLHSLIRKHAPALKPVMLDQMIGYGSYRYRYASGREGDSAVLALANNKSGISLYVNAVIDGAYVAERHRKSLPKASVGKSCIRIKRLSDIDLDALAVVIEEAARAGGAGARR